MVKLKPEITDSEDADSSASFQELQAINPERVLQRGYALVMQGDRVLPSRAAAEKERRMTLRFADGTVNVIKEEHHGGEEKADL